jgi:phosphoserine phosphatase
MSNHTYREEVEEWLKTARHPQSGKRYTEMVFQPMLELMDYLRDNKFKTYIVSGGGAEFMRPWTMDIYGIPAEQVIGSTVKTKFEMTDSGPKIMRLAEIDFFNDKAGKPVAINKYIGKKPIFAAGNSDGDLQMLQWTDANTYPSFQLYVHHTDAEREWAYDRDSHIGKLDKGLDEARKKEWTVVDMKNDWKVVYP